jgi:hypothetical protein
MKMGIVSANICCLEQGIDLLESIDQEAYIAKCGQCFESTIGGHIRHNLDHYAAFLDGYLDGKVDYDARMRDARIENSPEFAIGMMKSQIEGLRAIKTPDYSAPIIICMDEGGESLWSHTSVLRELQFLLSHTIHHYALIVAIASIQGITSFPEDFGIAPSTIRHQASLSR